MSAYTFRRLREEEVKKQQEQQKAAPKPMNKAKQAKK